MVGKPDMCEAVMVVDQSEVEFVGRGQHVALERPRGHGGDARWPGHDGRRRDPRREPI